MRRWDLLSWGRTWLIKNDWLAMVSAFCDSKQWQVRLISSTFCVQWADRLHQSSQTLWSSITSVQGIQVWRQSTADMSEHRYYYHSWAPLTTPWIISTCDERSSYRMNLLRFGALAFPRVLADPRKDPRAGYLDISTPGCTGWSQWLAG